MSKVGGIYLSCSSTLPHLQQPFVSLPSVPCPGPNFPAMVNPLSLSLALHFVPATNIMTCTH